MINLISPAAKKTVRLEYWTRVGTVWAWLLVAALVATAALLVPSYVLLAGQFKALNEQIVESTTTDSQFNDAAAVVKDANLLAKQLGKLSTTVHPSVIIDEAEKLRPAGVTLRTITISRTAEGKVETVQVQGYAATRETLASYKTALERSALFETALVPISDLARDANLPFVITVTLSSVSQTDL